MKTTKLCRLAIFIAASAASLGAEVIRIHVEDGRNGKTITNEHLQV
jgi:hypothetical protein